MQKRSIKKAWNISAFWLQKNQKLQRKKYVIALTIVEIPKMKAKIKMLSKKKCRTLIRNKSKVRYILSLIETSCRILRKIKLLQISFVIFEI